MGKYGVKIKNISAGTLYETNLGVRDYFTYKTAMFTNSLLCDYLIENGLAVNNGNSTKDIICLEFKFGSRSYDEDTKHLNKLIEKFKKSKEDENSKEKLIRLEKLEKLKKILKMAELNKDKYVKKSKEQIRTEYYKNGVDVVYTTKNKKGDLIQEETIHYKKLFRTTGKAKKGSCIFIREELYERTYNFLSMGLQIPKENSPIVELSAYMPLVSSTIVDKIKINPKNILIVKDVESFFETKVVSVETDENKQCVAKTINNYLLKNILFDGQALIDSSIFPKWADGYILLRHHFCKMASFNTDIQQFFKDYFGENYMNAEIEDMFGNKHFAKDIELITTDNAMKWVKFDVSYDYWCDRVYENNCMFGIVKSAHKSKLGEYQKMSYQMINSLDNDIMEDVAKTSVDYINKLKTDDDVFLEYLSLNRNFSNDYEVLVALVEQNRDFLRSDYFRDRKRKIIEIYTLRLKSGKLIQDADNLVIVGSPYAMLLHSVGCNINNDDTFDVEDNAIQCYTKRFKDGEYLASFRSPFNSKNNMGYLHNTYSDKMEKYFDLGEQIIAVNLNTTDFQDRNNGSDQDSDSLYVTNQKEMVECAKECYRKHPTIVNNIPKEKKTYNNTPDHYALVDNNLAQSSLIIGESSNLAQVALTYTYNFDDKRFPDYVCILSVLAQVAIDNSKRKFDINLESEVKRFKDLLDIKKNGFPEFWLTIRPKFNKKRINKDLKCPMNYLYNLKIQEFKPKTSTLPMSHFFVKFELNSSKRRNKKIEELIEKYSLDLLDYNVNDENISDRNDDYLLLRSDFNDLIKDISQVYISKNYLGLFSWLINRAFVIGSGVKSKIGITQSQTDMNKSILLKTLYNINPQNLLKILSGNR